MSTILKALRRLEEQKSAASPRPLRDEVVLVPARRRARSGVVVALVAAFAFAVLGGTGVWLLDRTQAQTEVPRAASAIDVAAPPSMAPMAAVEPERATEVTVASQDPMVTAAQAPSVPIPTAVPDFEVVRRRVDSQRALAAAVEEAVTVESREVAVARPSGAAPLPDTEPGFVDEAIPAARVTRSQRQAPIRVERTQWHPSPERRVAWVEIDGVTALREVREGERVGPYVVRVIEPAAVSFADGSSLLRREVGP